MSETRVGATILSVGTEITEGVIHNTHLRFMGAELKLLGLRVSRGLQIPDDFPLFVNELRRALAESDPVIITGGLGPTSDDLTREAVAEVAGVPLRFHESIWEELQRRFPGRRLSETNRKQAMVPQGFEALSNEQGTAPGLAGMAQGRLVVCLPGPPRELEPMFRDAVIPLLQRRFRIGDLAALHGTSLMVPESELEEALLRFRREGVRWGTRFADDRIAFTLLDGTEAHRESVFRALEDHFGPVRIRRGEVTPTTLLSAALRLRGERIALAESCTGGLLGKLLTDLPGSSDILWAGLVVYSNEAKERLLGVDSGLIERHGAVSEPVLRSMLRGLLERTPAQAVVAVTGIAGPAGGTADKPAGTVWLGAEHKDGTSLVRCFRFHGGRDAVRRRSAVAAFLMAETVVARRDWLDSWAD